jgi:hypothetical protein
LHFFRYKSGATEYLWHVFSPGKELLFFPARLNEWVPCKKKSGLASLHIPLCQQQYAALQGLAGFFSALHLIA